MSWVDAEWYGFALRVMRVEAGMTLKEVASAVPAVGSYGRLSDVERGKRNPFSPEVTLAIVEAVSGSWGQLFWVSMGNAYKRGRARLDAYPLKAMTHCRDAFRERGARLGLTAPRSGM